MSLNKYFKYKSKYLKNKIGGMDINKMFKTGGHQYSNNGVTWIESNTTIPTYIHQVRAIKQADKHYAKGSNNIFQYEFHDKVDNEDIDIVFTLVPNYDNPNVYTMIREDGRLAYLKKDNNTRRVNSGISSREDTTRPDNMGVSSHHVNTRVNTRPDHVNSVVNSHNVNRMTEIIKNFPLHRDLPCDFVYTTKTQIINIGNVRILTEYIESRTNHVNSVVNSHNVNRMIEIIKNLPLYPDLQGDFVYNTKAQIINMGNVRILAEYIDSRSIPHFRGILLLPGDIIKVAPGGGYMTFDIEQIEKLMTEASQTLVSIGVTPKSISSTAGRHPGPLYKNLFIWGIKSMKKKLNVSPSI